MKFKHIFILGPNNSGTTLLMRIMKTNKLVVGMKWEGKLAAKKFEPHPPNFGMKSLWTEKKEFASPSQYNWPEIKKCWIKEWKKDKKYNNNKNNDMFLLEKTPMHMLLVDQLCKEFDKPFFIAMMRNPYAVAEGILRKTTHTDVKRIATHLAKCLTLQMSNIEKLGNDCVHFTYEDFTNTPLIKELFSKSKYPQLADVDFDKEYTVQSYKGEHSVNKITNYNDVQIKNISNEDLKIINGVYKNYKKEFEFFNYEIIKD